MRQAGILIKMADTVTKTKNMLAGLNSRLVEREKKQQAELEELQELTRALVRIHQSSEELPDIPDLISANQVLACKVETAQEALQLLKDGNARFLSRDVKSSGDSKVVHPHPLELHFGQRPHAVLVTCSDSRVPPELVFDQSLGDLFVVRLAGNTVDTLARASILYALEHLHAPLVVVMGHENCGAVTAALASDADLMNEAADIKALVQNIRCGLKMATLLGEQCTREEQIMAGVVCNVHHTVKALRSHPDIAEVARTKGIEVVGGYYAFNGAVTFFDDPNSPKANGGYLNGTRE